MLRVCIDIFLQGALTQEMLSKAKSCLILSLRHLGDAVVVSGFVNAVVADHGQLSVDILGRGDLESVTRAFCNFRQYVPIDFPCFGHHRRDPAAIRDAVRKIIALRARHYDVCINLTGDLRENLISGMLCAKEVIAPVWPEDHPFRRHIRTLSVPRLTTQSVSIPSSARGYYASIEHFARHLGLGGLRWPARPAGSGKEGKVVALHPGASHASKKWPPEKWRELIHILAAEGFCMRLYGSRSEEADLRSEYGSEIADYGVALFTGTISEFLDSLSDVAILVGMDSFSAHAAYAFGIRSVVLHGPYDPSVMTPPSGIPLSAGRLCNMFPCYNGRNCKNTAAPYVCVRGIETQEVAATVNAVLQQCYP